MAEIAFLEYDILRAKYTPKFFEMLEGDESTNTPIDVLSQFDDIKIQVRKSKQPETGLVKTWRYTAGTIFVTDTNVVSWDMTLDVPAGTYWFDVFFKFIDSDHWTAYVSGIVNLTNNSKVIVFYVLVIKICFDTVN